MVIGARDFIDVFRMRFEMIRDLEGIELIAALRDWFLWLRESGPTAELLRELTLQAKEAVSKYGELCATARSELETVSGEVSLATPDLGASIEARSASPELLEGAQHLAIAFDDLEKQSREPALPATWSQFPQSPDLAFKHLVMRASHSEALQERPERGPLIKRIQEAQWAIQRRFLELMLPLAGRGVHAHAALLFLMQCLEVGPTDVRVQSDGWASVDPVAAIQDAIFGPREAAPHARVQHEQFFPAKIAIWESVFRRHAEALYRELSFRLSARRQLETAILRYGVRAERYDRDRLRQLVEASTGRVEAVLASDCAKYLFDCGFAVLTEVAIGNVRADIVAPDLYVEAKQVGDRTEAKTKVLGAYRQALGSARRLRNLPNGVPPIVLLVFLVSGTRIEAPSVVPAWLSSPAVGLYVVDLRTEGQGADEGLPVAIDVAEFKRVVESLDEQT